MLVTAIVSFISFNFNKLLHMVISWICNNMNDESVPTWGPYRSVLPITPTWAMVDKKPCINQIKLLLHWFWNPDMGGISTSDILIRGEIIQIEYEKKYTTDHVKKHICLINTSARNIMMDGNIKSIMFGEVVLLPRVV